MRSSAFDACSASDGRDPLGNGRIGERQDSRGKVGGVLRPRTPDRDRGDRHAGRHLHDRIERIGAPERSAIQRNPDHRASGQRGQHAGQVGGQPGRTDEEQHAGRLGLGDVGMERIGLAVSADDRGLPGDAVVVEHVEAALQGGQIGAGAADHGDGRHRRQNSPPP